MPRLVFVKAGGTSTKVRFMLQSSVESLSKMKCFASEVMGPNGSFRGDNMSASLFAFLYSNSLQRKGQHHKERSLLPRRKFFPLIFATY